MGTITMLNDIITRCENLAKTQGKALRALPHYSSGNSIDENDQTIETMSDTDLFDNTQHPDILSDDEASIDDLPHIDCDQCEQTPVTSEVSYDNNPTDLSHFDNEVNDLPGPFDELFPDELYVKKTDRT